MEHIITIAEMTSFVRRDRRTLWAWVKNKQFPEPIRMNGRTVGWPESVYQDWLAKLINDNAA